MINDAVATEGGEAVIEVHEGAEPGMYVIFVEGLTSGRRASSALQVVPPQQRPALLVASAPVDRTASQAGLTVRVTAVDRYDDRLVALHVTAENKSGAAVDLDLGEFSAVDDGDAQYEALSEDARTRWRTRVSPAQTTTGTVLLNRAVDPGARSLDVTFADVFTPRGFRDFVITDIEVPAEQ